MKKILSILCMATALPLSAQTTEISGLNEKQFDKFWRAESESPDYKISFKCDTAEIVAPKGFTLWRKEKMRGKVTVEYDACVVVEDGNPSDRLSDLNCYWMASDRKYPEILWKRESWRKGGFVNRYSLQMYYKG